MLSAFSSKASISDGMGSICVYGMGRLHVLEGTMNSERYIEFLEQQMLPSRRCVFPEIHNISGILCVCVCVCVCVCELTCFS